jgi:hypothetical protein
MPGQHHNDLDKWKGLPAERMPRAIAINDKARLTWHEAKVETGFASFSTRGG